MLRLDDYEFRPPVRADAPAYAEAVRESLATLAAWMPWAHADYSADDALAWIALCEQGWAELSSFEFAIFQSGRFIGGCGLNQFNAQHGYCNLGYWVRQSAQGRGAATAAIRALSQHAFRACGQTRVEIAIAVGNTASLAAARKAGAVEEGIARNRLKLGPRAVDAHLLSLVPR